MGRLAAQLLVRVGLVMLALGVLGRLLPMPDRADVMADEFAIAVSLTLVLAASLYLAATMGAREGERRTTKRHPTSTARTGAKETQ
jgi:hypothetical protein